MLGELTAPSMSLRDYAVLMIMLSDNTATNVLIDAVGMEGIKRGSTRSASAAPGCAAG